MLLHWLNALSAGTLHWRCSGDRLTRFEGFRRRSVSLHDVLAVDVRCSDMVTFDSVFLVVSTVDVALHFGELDFPIIEIVEALRESGLDLVKIKPEMISDLHPGQSIELLRR